MLQNMRSGAQSIFVKVILFGLLLLAMLGLAFTDVQGMFRSGGASARTAVAKIDGYKITAQEFDAVLQRTLREQNISSEDAYRNALPLIVLNQEINSRLYALAAHDLGVIIDDKTAATRLKEDLLTPIANSAKITEKEALARLLQNVGSTERAFVSSYKSQLASEQLIATIPASARAPAQLVTDALKRRYEWRRGEYFELTAADLGDSLKPATDAELKEFYDTIAEEFLLPEYRSFNVVLIDAKALGLDAKPDAAAVEKYYTENSEHFAEPEQRKIEQLIAADEATANELKAEAEAGSTLSDIAKKAKAASGTPRAKTVFAVSTYTEEDLDVELSKPAFAAPANGLVGPVKTPLGWHVMKIVTVVPARTLPLAEVRAQIEKEMAEESTGEELYNRATEIDDLVANGQPLPQVAEQFKLKLDSFKDVTSEGTNKSGEKLGASLPAFAKIVETAFTLDEGQTSQLTETSDGGFLLIETTSITRAQAQPFDAVRDEVADSLRQKRMGELFDRKSAEITEKMQLGESFEATASRMGKKVVTTGLVQRASTPAKAGMERGVLPALFSLDKIGQTMAVTGDQKVTILRLAERKIDAPREAAKADSDALRNTLDRAYRNDILEQYRSHLLRKYKVSINEEAVTQLYSRRDEDSAVE